MSMDAAGKAQTRRVLLKLSGEALMGGQAYGVDVAMLDRLAGEVAQAAKSGIQIALVIGGGNYFRGVSTMGRTFERATADTVGMLATTMNALIFKDALLRCNVEARVMSALEMPRVAELFVRSEAVRHLEKGRVVVFSGGTGHPYFSTDTGAALRALEIHADMILKGTKVEGVYSADPVKVPDATFFDHIRYQEVLEKGLAVMDATAVALCMDNRMPLHVFSIRTPGNILRVLRGDHIGTVVS